ncbi:MAG: zinc metallopeptidase [Eubacteriaceae bacterium]|nr:zinc metallopeptidase [Eubacteriaceae bacterium]
MRNYIYYDATYFIYMLPALAISLFAQMRVNSAFRKYRLVRMSSGATGQQAATRILLANGLESVRIEGASGLLSDHYDPAKRILRLSPEVMQGASVASVAIAAHECGHALQHQQNYAFLRLRSALVAYAGIGNMASYFLILAGILFSASGLVLAGIVFFSVFVLFQLITLPVELNASARAKAELDRLGMAAADEMQGVSSMLSAAALTYVAATITALLQLLRLLSLFRRRD